MRGICLVCWSWWRVHMSDMTRLCVWYEIFMRVSRLIHACGMMYTFLTWCFVFVTWRIGMCNVTHLLWQMTHSYLWRGSSLYVPWRIWSRKKVDSSGRWCAEKGKNKLEHVKRGKKSKNICSVLQIWCSILQYVFLWYSLLQFVAACRMWTKSRIAYGPFPRR